MHGKGHSHNSLFGMNSYAANTAVTLMLVLLFLIFLLLFMSMTATPAQGQNSPPLTAVQAAKMPQFASRLAHPSRRVAPPKSAHAAKHRGPLNGTDIYDNGPIDGNTDAWIFNFGFVISDSFNIAARNQSQLTGMSFGAWLFPGDTLTSVEVSITSGPNVGIIYFDQTVNFTQQGNCPNNQYGFNICTETATFNGPALNAGTYWVNLQSASVPSGDPVYWDENSGVGCQGSGCPSQAWDNMVGSIPSESFTILGNSTTTTTTTTSNDYACPPREVGFHEIHDFGVLGTNDTPSGVTFDGFGGLAGTLATAGGYGAGVVYASLQNFGNQFFYFVYNFLGGSNGSSPEGVIAGPGGVLYGGASGGILNCGTNGSSYCGVIYQVASPTAYLCATALCSWTETPIYQFTGNQDAWGGAVTTIDSAGNLYGYGNNMVFELSPSQEGWTETILYTFSGGSDGNEPNSLLLGHDGNLYGTTLLGGDGNCAYDGPCGVVFQLVPSGNGWTENVLYSFTGTSDGGWPGGLVQDSAGNVYGFNVCSTLYNRDCDFISNEEYGLIFKLTQSAGGWEFADIHNAVNDCGTAKTTFHALAMDGAGDLFASEGGVDQGVGQIFNCGKVLDVTTGAFPVTGAADIFYNLTSDAGGNLFGTTNTCGSGNPQQTTGMIWEYSP